VNVPHAAVLCLGMGLAAHLAAPHGRPLRRMTKKIALEAFLLAWVPLATVLLWRWPDWSWCYLAPLAGHDVLALVLGLGVELGAFLLSLHVAGVLSRSAQVAGLLLLGLITLVLFATGPSSFHTVGSAAEFATGGGVPLSSSTPLLITLSIGGLWLAGVGAWGVRRVRQHSLRDRSLGSRIGFL